jgi:hypothetical protein
MKSFNKGDRVLYSGHDKDGYRSGAHYNFERLTKYNKLRARVKDSNGLLFHSVDLKYLILIAPKSIDNYEIF